jgi:cytochrome c-type biogenesis protein CcmH
LRRFTESLKALDAELAKNPAPARTAGDKPRPSAPAAASTPNPPRTGPSEKDIAAASTQVPEQQKQMVQGMVDRLAERLKTESSDLDGWLRLLRSYKVLGDMEKARDATETARRAFAGEPEKLRQLNEAIKGLGL